MVDELIIGGNSGSRHPEGTFEFMLMDIKLKKMPIGQYAKGDQSPDDMVDRLEWHFIDEESAEIVTHLTGLSTDKRSTVYKIGPALNGGIMPFKENEQFNVNLLLHRYCYIGIIHNSAGFARCNTFMALPSGHPRAVKPEDVIRG